MPRHARHAPGDVVYHVLNRAAGRRELFRNADDYAAFLRVLAETIERIPMRLCGYCLMPNHWHLALWPARDGDLSRFMQRLTITHVRRWVEHRHRVGLGPVYQGRFKSFPVEDDAHFTTMLRYVERNPLHAKLVTRGAALDVVERVRGGGGAGDDGRRAADGDRPVAGVATRGLDRLGERAADAGGGSGGATVDPIQSTAGFTDLGCEDGDAAAPPAVAAARATPEGR